MYPFNSCTTLLYTLTSHYNFMSIKVSIELYVRTHNNKEELYIVPEELVLHITIYLSCIVIFFDFTTNSHL